MPSAAALCPGQYGTLRIRYTDGTVFDYARVSYAVFHKMSAQNGADGLVLQTFVTPRRFPAALIVMLVFFGTSQRVLGPYRPISNTFE